MLLVPHALGQHTELLDATENVEYPEKQLGADVEGEDETGPVDVVRGQPRAWKDVVIPEVIKEV